MKTVHELLKDMPYVSLNGKIIPANKAVSHLLSPRDYGFSCFEGLRIRKAQTPQGQLSDKTGFIFRLDDHLRRLHTSAEVLDMKLPFSVEELKKQAIELAQANMCIDAYLRINVTYDSNAMGLIHDNSKLNVFMAYWPWPSYHGADSIPAYLEPDIEIPTSNAFLAKAKRASNYDYRMLALKKAKALGAGDTLLQASIPSFENGEVIQKKYILEGSAQNLFLFQEKNGNVKVVTPPTTFILDGITRRTVIDILKELNVPYKVSNFSLSDIEPSDSLVMTGTATGVLPVHELWMQGDSQMEVRSLAKSDLVKKVKEIYDLGVRGQSPVLKHYLTPVELSN